MIQSPSFSRRHLLGVVGTTASLASTSSLAAEEMSRQDAFLNVQTNYGAVGDGIHDDTAALQRAIDDISLGRSRGVLFLPAGTYRVTNTLHFPIGAGGGIISGTGCYPGDPRTKKRTGPHTVVVWDGEPGGTMLSAEGNLGWQISNVTFVGAMSKRDRRAGVIYHCKYNREFGSGWGLFQACWFVDADIALKMGDRPRDFGCADYVFIQICFMFCGVGVHVGNNQGVNYNFLYLGANWCNSAIVAEEGGHFYIQNAQIVGCGDPTTHAWTFDFRNLNDNASVVSINGLRVEQHTKTVLRASGVGRVTIVGYEEAQGNQATTMIELSGVSATIAHSRAVTHSPGLPHIKLIDGTQRARFVGTDMFFDSETWEVSEWLSYAPNSSAALERCFFSNRGKSIPAWTNDPLIGPVILMARTAKEGEVELTLAGRSGLDVSGAGDKILVINTIITNSASGEVISFADEFLLSAANVMRITPRNSPKGEGGDSLSLRFSDDKRRVRLFARLKSACVCRSLVELRGI
ncbi:glycosyl hydrolase family 28-related protein [Bradyrhizobium sp. USDA 336]|uniref:glycosyl hydrolase family 28-related protein n=1 Tax=Bradyrhizobium sp. USDA 336 TaxID=3156311 RepID=UPI003838014E